MKKTKTPPKPGIRTMLEIMKPLMNNCNIDVFGRAVL
jgi:hypothetical protein